MIVKYKVSDFAKDLNLSAKKVLDELAAMGSTGKKNSSNLEENELNYLLEKFSKDNSVANLDEFLNSAKAPKEEPKAEKKAEKKVEKKAEAPKAEKAPAKKPAARKAPAKKAAAPAAPVVTLTVQYMGKEMTQQAMVEAVKAQVEAEIKTLDLYAKPEEAAVYLSLIHI